VYDDLKVCYLHDDPENESIRAIMTAKLVSSFLFQRFVKNDPEIWEGLKMLKI